MGTFTSKFDSAKQDWTTPDTLFERLDNEFHFTIDLAADDTNYKVDTYYTKQTNALVQDWKGIGWLNPPYGDISAEKLVNWIKKAYNDTNKYNSVVVMLIPARTNTTWWRDYVCNAREVRFIIGRPKFGDAKHGLPQPLALVIFAPHSKDTQFTIFNLKCK